MKIKNIVIVGGGSAGWMTAAAIAYKLPNINLTLIESPKIGNVGVGESTLGHINNYMNLLDLKDEEWMKDCYVWLYRGAWQEWSIEDIDMAVPLSPEELLKKRRAIFKHQSQKDRPLFPGHDSREFWQRAEDRNRNTANIYDQLGLPEYEAIEAFKRFK